MCSAGLRLALPETTSSHGLTWKPGGVRTSVEWEKSSAHSNLENLHPREVGVVKSHP